MDRLKGNAGYNIIEVLVVVTVAAIVFVIGASSLSSKFAVRRSVDELTNNIGSTLQLIKLQSARTGAEHRIVLAGCDTIDDEDPDCPICESYNGYSEGDGEFSIIVERGDSNRQSGVWCIQSTQTKKISPDLALAASPNVANDPFRISFLPTGMRSDFRTDGLVESFTLIPEADRNVDRCGQVEVTPSGGIRIIEGRWDETDCVPVLDSNPTPIPSPSP